MSPSDTSAIRRTFPVPGGPAVRLRLAVGSDRDRVRALLAGRGIAVDDLELRRLLSYDPSRRHVLCALAPIDGAETLVAIGAIDDGEDVPDVLVADERLGGSVTDVLGRVLVERARSRAA